MKLSTLAIIASSLINYVQADTTQSLVPRTYSTYSPKASDIAKAASNATTLQWTSDVKGKNFDRFVVIWLENTDFLQAAEEPNLAWLASQGITLTNYWAVTHPSEPNYMASVGGDYFAVDDDRFIAVPKNVSTLADLLDERGISFGSYQEHLPYTGFQGFNYSNQVTFANDYVRKHNPFIIYDSYTSNATRLSVMKNFTEFEKDLNDQKLPQYVIITPNMTNDAHDTTVKVAGQWSRNFLTPLLQNEYFMNNTLVLLTFDENETYGEQNTAFSILLGGVVPDNLKGTVDNTFYDHYTQIASAEVNWDLHNLGRNDVTANIWQSLANSTGIKNKIVDTKYLVNNNTYIGYFNDDKIAFPAPNVSAVNIAGKGILPSISSVWASEYNKQVSENYFTQTTTLVTGSFTNGASIFEELQTGSSSFVTKSVSSLPSSKVSSLSSKLSSAVSSASVAKSASVSASASGASSSVAATTTKNGAADLVPATGMSALAALMFAALI
jgi:acid phosphatase